MAEQSDVFVCDFERCYKVCALKTGLMNHKQRMHEVSKEEAEINCKNVGLSLIGQQT